MIKCLVVDDVEVTRFTSKEILSSFGGEVDTVADIDAAELALQRSRYDVIFVDWHLGRASGLDLVKKIKTTFHAGQKIVMISGVEQKDKEAEARQAGADMFIQKPTTHESIEGCLKALKLI